MAFWYGAWQIQISHRQATQEAFERAGMKVMRILEEPTAAAIAYNLHKGRHNWRMIVPKLGWVKSIEIRGYEIHVKHSDLYIQT